MDYCIEANELVKSFNTVKALDGLSFRVPCNASYALLGPNGAGKSTTLRIIAGLLRPDFGTIKVCGSDVFQDSKIAKGCIGYLPEDALPFLNLTVKENLEYVSILRGLKDYEPRIIELIKNLDLTEYIDRPTGSLSRGNRQKLAIAMALIHEPQVILLDEPLNYLDIPTQEQVIEYLKSRKTTMLISTHIMSIAERLTTDVIIINKGKVVWEGSIDELHKLANANERIEQVVARIMGGGFEGS